MLEQMWWMWPSIVVRLEPPGVEAWALVNAPMVAYTPVIGCLPERLDRKHRPLCIRSSATAAALDAEPAGRP